ncbi:fimbrillin family protein [Bacteroides faecium]|uniref:Fimbrillin family protein n=1 Tax=Bacteroides faecium TaxID=2715212 RepID=A0A6H0KQ90_9BACE|nr:fimbrillin family protein [Bacteroides faecium]QIU95455.1 fimbrillin family protein [Bacteroides faecium]
MKQLRNYSLLAGTMLTLALTSCGNDGIEAQVYDGPVAAQVTAGINGVLTRAMDASWENNDAIGISCSSTNTNYANMRYVTTGDGTFTHEGGTKSGIFFQGTEEVTFSAYYPFSGTEKKSAGIISDVTTENQTQQKDFDYLYATTKTTYASPTISFTGASIFKHKMSRLILKITTSATDGFEVGDVLNGTYSISGIKHSGTFGTADGTATATGSATDDWTITATAQDANSQRTYSMIFYPQDQPTLTFKAVIGGQTYAKDITPTLAASTSNTYTITVKKTGLVVNSSTIEGWGEEHNESGDATMQ